MKPATLRTAGILIAAALSLAGCASSESTTPDLASSPSPSDSADPSASADDPAVESSSLDEVTVTGKPGEQPTLEFDAPLTFTELVTKVYEPGTGAEITVGQRIDTRIYQVSGEDGKEEFNNYTEGDLQKLTLDEGQSNPTLLNAFVGQKVGVRVLLGAPGTAADETTGTEATASSVALIEVVDAVTPPEPLDRAEGTAVTPAAGLPTVTLDDTGKPSITIPSGYTAPTELVVQPLIEGTGDVVKETDTITAHYTGWKLNGEQFDSSWDRGEPASFSLQQVVAGWTQGLAGQKVGSQVLLIIPPSLGYGASEGHELQNETLVFVVDILGIG